MFSRHQEREDYEDELYQDEADSGSSDVDSELEFRLYSQLHYCSETQEAHKDSEEVQSSIPQAQPQQNSLPPPAPVDVIVIDSGTDAATVSDNTEEDESVCAKKGKTSKRCRKWQPQSFGQSHVKTERDSPDEIVVLDSESEESSDSDESSDSHSIPPFVVDLDSDSDGLENWMIVSQEKQDGDQNIELNLFAQDNCENQEYVNDGREGPYWSVSEKDKQAQIFNKGVGPRRLSNRYYNEKSVTCHNCNKIGHLSKNCPTQKKVPCCSLCGDRGHLARTCPTRHCSNCSLPGHTYDDCLERAYWHKRCHRCGMIGHFLDVCPEIWRQYHLTITPGPLRKASDPNACKTPAYCCNCSKKGHFSYECNERRMYNGMCPTLPFVCYYDTTQDIRRRDQRLEKKARELWGVGLTAPPDGGVVSSTPQPPRKKQKTNQSPCKPPTQTNNSHTPKSRIAHTPKHHPQPHKQNTPLNFKQNPKTPTNTPQSAFTPQEQSQKKAKKKKKKKKKQKTNSAFKVLDEDADFPRGCHKGPQPKEIFRSPWTANKRPDTLFETGKNNNKKKESLTKKKERKWRKRQKKAGNLPDEDLFAIKQKRKKAN